MQVRWRNFLRVFLYYASFHIFMCRWCTDPTAHLLVFHSIETLLIKGGKHWLKRWLARGRLICFAMVGWFSRWWHVIVLLWGVFATPLNLVLVVEHGNLLEILADPLARGIRSIFRHVDFLYEKRRVKIIVEVLFFFDSDAIILHRATIEYLIISI